MMPTKASQRVMAYQKANTDRIVLQIPKGKKKFVHAAAWMNGQTLSEFCRDAILEKAGLIAWPGSDLDTGSRSAARISLRNMQIEEYGTDAGMDAAMERPERYTTEVNPDDAVALRDFCGALQKIENDPFNVPVPVTLTIDQVRALRHILSMAK